MLIFDVTVHTYFMQPERENSEEKKNNYGNKSGRTIFNTANF